MASAELVVIASDTGASEKTAGTLYTQMKELGIDVQRVATVQANAEALSDEVRTVLARRPDVLVVTGGEGPVVADGLCRGTGRSLEAGLPAGATPFESFDGLNMLVAQTLLVSVPGTLADSAWTDEIEPCLAEWTGQPSHVRGELVILDSGAGDVDDILASLADQHPGVYLRTEPPTGEQGIRVAGLCCNEGEAAIQAVNVALSAVERAAVAKRLRVSSTGRVGAHAVGPESLTAPALS